jgi:hypothetical protein
VAVVVLAIWLIADTPLLACPVCFRAEESALTDGVRAAVFVLLGVTAVVLAFVGVWLARVGRGLVREP